jgi:3-methyladenine DNA glycosylase AlkD
MKAKDIQIELKILENKQQAEILKKFFKTGPGEYGEGDLFLGIKVPVLRKISQKYQNIELEEIKEILYSPIHEHRMLALFILILIYNKGDYITKKKIYKLYLQSTQFINNWDLVDCSAEHIVGSFLFNRDKTTLYTLAKSKILWERRISVIATFYFIKHHTFSETLKIAEILIKDQHDLIHKAVGWMLREIGKRDLSCEENFLKKHYQYMPRTMLRYALEKFPKEKRGKYLKGTI